MFLILILGLVIADADLGRYNNLSPAWGLNVASLFDSDAVESLTSEQYENLRKEPTIAFIYHPSCGDSRRAAPEFQNFAESFEAKNLKMRIIEINVSEEEARDPPAEGKTRGLLKQQIGRIDHVPQIAFYDKGKKVFLPSDWRRDYYGYDMKSVLNFAENPISVKESESYVSVWLPILIVGGMVALTAFGVEF